MKTATRKSKKRPVSVARRGAKSRYTSTKESKTMFDKPTIAEKAATAKVEATKVETARVDAANAEKAAKVARDERAAALRADRPTGLEDPVVVHRTAVEWLCMDLPLTCTVLSESGTGDDATVQATFTATFPSKFLMRGRLNRDANYLADIRLAPRT